MSSSKTKGENLQTIGVKSNAYPKHKGSNPQTIENAVKLVLSSPFSHELRRLNYLPIIFSENWNKKQTANQGGPMKEETNY